MKHTLKWFQNRIGKRIFRDAYTCSCPTCSDATHNGLMVNDKDHAQYLYDIQGDLDINYYDKL